MIYKTPLKERDITIQIRNYLKIKRIFHWKAWQGLGSEKGVPDILGVLPGGKALMIEIKTEKGRVSEQQEAFIEKARKLGAVAFVARSVNEVMQVLGD